MGLILPLFLFNNSKVTFIFPINLLVKLVVMFQAIPQKR